MVRPKLPGPTLRPPQSTLSPVYHLSYPVPPTPLPQPGCNPLPPPLLPGPLCLCRCFWTPLHAARATGLPLQGAPPAVVVTCPGPPGRAGSDVPGPPVTVTTLGCLCVLRAASQTPGSLKAGPTCPSPAVAISKIKTGTCALTWICFCFLIHLYEQPSKIKRVSTTQRTLRNFLAVPLADPSDYGLYTPH